MSNSTLFFQPSCPSGGTFHVCNTPKSSFIGCCDGDNDPCTSLNGCPAGNLRPTSFNETYYGQFHDQSCNDGLFYTCTGTKPAFLGCCKSNPCASDGCPTSDLAGMRLSNDPKIAADFLGTPAPSSTVSSSTTSSTSTATSTSSTTSNPTSTAMPAQIPHQTGLPLAAIAGISIGGVLLLALAIVMFFLWRRTVRLRETVESSRGPPGQNGFDDLSGTTFPAMVHSNKPYTHNSNQSYAYSSLAPSPNFSPDPRQGRFSATSGSSYDSDPRTSSFGGRSPQLGSDNGMVYSPPLPPVQELDALEQQMSELDAGNEQSVQQVLKRKSVGVGKGGDREYVAYSPDRHADMVVMPPGREG